MNRPRLVTVSSAALASALAFYVITRSGLAGTLAGAAVASMVSTGTAHWVGGGLDRCSTWWIERRRRPSDPDEACDGCEDPPLAQATDIAEDPLASPAPSSSLLVWRRGLLRWAPLILGALAIGLSVYALATGSPLERTVMRERVVQAGTEKVIVRKEIVTVTVPVGELTVPVGEPSAAGGATGGTTLSPSIPAKTVAHGPTTTTTARPSTTTTSVVTSTTAPTTTAPVLGGG